MSFGCSTKRLTTADFVRKFSASKPNSLKFLSFRTSSPGSSGSKSTIFDSSVLFRGFFRYSMTSNSTSVERRISKAPRDLPHPGLWYRRILSMTDHP